MPNVHRLHVGAEDFPMFHNQGSFDGDSNGKNICLSFIYYKPITDTFLRWIGSCITLLKCIWPPNSRLKWCLKNTSSKFNNSLTSITEQNFFSRSLTKVQDPIDVAFHIRLFARRLVRMHMQRSFHVHDPTAKPSSWILHLFVWSDSRVFRRV